jgi:hypothetical protein
MSSWRGSHRAVGGTRDEVSSVRPPENWSTMVVVTSCVRAEGVFDASVRPREDWSTPDLVVASWVRAMG